MEGLRNYHAYVFALLLKFSSNKSKLEPVCAGKVKMSLRFEEFLDRSRIRRSTVHSNSIRDHIEDNLKTRNLLKFSDYAGCGVKADLHGQRSTRRGTVL